MILVIAHQQDEDKLRPYDLPYLLCVPPLCPDHDIIPT
jgi:hypothetical protein